MNKLFIYAHFVLCLLVPAIAKAVDPPQFKALLITATKGWNHRAVLEAIPALQKLATTHHFALTWEPNIGQAFTKEKLAQYDVILFVLTTGDILNAPQQAAFKDFIQSGKGFVGIHSAADTEHDWPWYNRLVGRMFIIHPAVQTAQLTVKNKTFPGLEYSPDKFWFTDEYYEFGEEKISGLNYLLTIDEKTYNPVANWGEKSGKGMGPFHPLAWYHEYDGGRSFYTALGHVPAVYQNAWFLQHVYGGIFWAATGRGLNRAGAAQ